MKSLRTRRGDIAAISTATKTIELGENQTFYQTPKMYELWQEFPRLSLIRRWSRTAVFWVTLSKEGRN